MNTMKRAAVMDIETEDSLFTLSDSVSLNKDFERRLRTPSKRDIYEEGRGAPRKVEYGIWFGIVSTRSSGGVNVRICKVAVEEMMEVTASDFFDLDKDSPLYKDMEDILEREKNNQLRLHSYADVWNE